MKRYTKKEVFIEDGKTFVLCNAHEEDCDGRLDNKKIASRPADKLVV